MYNYWIDPIIVPGIEAVPMYWKGINAPVTVGGNSDWILTFNEPDRPDQANMTPTAGVTDYHKVENENPDARLVCPAVSAEGPQWRWQWLNVYRQKYGKMPRVDAVAVHVYPQTEAYFHQVVDEAWRFAQQFGVRLWVTEYAYLPGFPGGMPRAVEMTKWLTEHFASNPYRYERWSPFILSCKNTEPWAFGKLGNPSLLDYATGALTPMGKAYTSVAPELEFALPGTDVDGDGDVDIGDVVRVASSVGKLVLPGKDAG
jgi:hypothetical protein